MTQNNFAKLFSSKMMEQYYAMKVVNSGKVESSLLKEHKIPMTAFSWILELIPKLGNKIADLFKSTFKKYTVDRMLGNASANLKNPTSDEFDIYAKIILKALDKTYNTNTIHNINTSLFNNDYAKSLAKAFFAFSSENSLDDLWQSDDSDLKTELQNKSQNGEILVDRAKFVLLATKFISSIKMDGKKVRVKEEVQSHCVTTQVMQNLDSIMQIKTECEKNKEKIVELKQEMRNNASNVCTMLSQASVIPFTSCMQNISSPAAA